MWLSFREDFLTYQGKRVQGNNIHESFLRGLFRRDIYKQPRWCTAAMDNPWFPTSATQQLGPRAHLMRVQELHILSELAVAAVLTVWHKVDEAVALFSDRE